MKTRITANAPVKKNSEQFRRATKFTRAATLPRRISPLSSRGLNIERFWIAINSNSPRMQPRIGRIPPGLLLWKAATRRCDKRVGTRVRELWGEISLKFSEQSYARRSRDGALPLECPTTSHALITFTFKLAVFARVPGTYYLFTTAHFSVIRLRPRVLEESHVWWGKNKNGREKLWETFCRICIIISTNSFLFFWIVTNCNIWLRIPLSRFKKNIAIKHERTYIWWAEWRDAPRHLRTCRLETETIATDPLWSRTYSRTKEKTDTWTESEKERTPPFVIIIHPLHLALPILSPKSREPSVYIATRVEGQRRPVINVYLRRSSRVLEKGEKK